MKSKAGRMGKRGTVVIPVEMRLHYGFEDGSMIVAEPSEQGVLIRPAVTTPVEIYTDERKAEFLLNNAMSEQDYEWAREEVRKLGLDPDKIPNTLPKPSFLKSR